MHSGKKKVTVLFTNENNYYRMDFMKKILSNIAKFHTGKLRTVTLMIAWMLDRGDIKQLIAILSEAVRLHDSQVFTPEKKQTTFRRTLILVK